MRSIANLICVAGVACITSMPMAHAGTVMTTQVTDHSDNSVTTQELKVDNGHLRMDVTGRRGKENSIVYKNNALYVIDYGEKSYLVMDEATMAKLGDRMADARKQMAAQMADLPPEQRAMMARMMGRMGNGAAAAPPALPNFLRTNRTQTVAGIHCQVWEATENGVKTAEVCVAAKGAVPGAADALAGMKSFGNAMAKMTSHMGLGAQKGLQNAWSGLDRLDGMPIAHRDYEGGKLKTEMLMTDVHAASVPAAAFEMPAGYKLKAMNMGSE